MHLTESALAESTWQAGAQQRAALEQADCELLEEGTTECCLRAHSVLSELNVHIASSLNGILSSGWVQYCTVLQCSTIYISSG